MLRLRCLNLWILGQWEATITLELSNGEVKFLVILFEVLEHMMRKSTDKASLIIKYHLSKVVPDKFWFEIRQIKSTVIIGAERIRNVQHHFIRVLTLKESVR